MAERALRERLGYEAPIRLGTWQRITRYGAPRMWSYGWLITCIWLGMFSLMKVGWRWALVVFAMWFIVQCTMALFTYWNVYWDKALFKRWQRQYQAYYRAG